MAQKPTPEKPVETRDQATGGTGEDQMRSTAGLPAQGQADEANENPIVTTATAAENRQNDKPTLGKDRLHGPNMDEVLRASGTPKPKNEDESKRTGLANGAECEQWSRYGGPACQPGVCASE